MTVVVCQNCRGHMLCPDDVSMGDIRGTVLDYWPTGQAIDPAPVAIFITKFISFAQVVPGPVYSVESWPKTPIISFQVNDIVPLKYPMTMSHQYVLRQYSIKIF